MPVSILGSLHLLKTSSQISSASVLSPNDLNVLAILNFTSCLFLHAILLLSPHIRHDLHLLHIVTLFAFQLPFFVPTPCFLCPN